ncbi:VanZ family protein [Planctomycetaceae bacterium]|nr:VanZ family protein [Planctomycetaceae bacterium]
MADDSSKYRRERMSAAIFLIGFIVYSVFLVIATHLPQVHTLVRGPGVDKWLHLFAYACQTVLAMGILYFTNRLRVQFVLVLFIALAAFGAADEITQPMFHRQAEFFDWLADCVGIVLGMCSVYLFVHSRNKEDI